MSILLIRELITVLAGTEIYESEGDTIGNDEKNAYLAIGN